MVMARCFNIQAVGGGGNIQGGVAQGEYLAGERLGDQYLYSGPGSERYPQHHGMVIRG